MKKWESHFAALSETPLVFYVILRADGNMSLLIGSDSSNK